MTELSVRRTERACTSWQTGEPLLKAHKMVPMGDWSKLHLGGYKFTKYKAS